MITVEKAIEWLDIAQKDMADSDLREAIRMGREALYERAMMQKDEIKIRYHADIEATKQVEGSDWIDLRTAEDVYLEEGQYKRISLGISAQLPNGCEAIIAPRSSTFERYGILPANGIGIIDEKYCGDGDVWQFPVYATRECFIPKNARICQFRLLEHQQKVEFKVVEALENENRKGFGSTGTY